MVQVLISESLFASVMGSYDLRAIRFFRNFRNFDFLRAHFTFSSYDGWTTAEKKTKQSSMGKISSEHPDYKDKKRMFLYDLLRKLQIEKNIHNGCLSNMNCLNYIR